MKEPAGETAASGFLRSGGWLLVAGLVLATVVLGWHAVSLVRHRRGAAIGDGRTVESYRFDVTNFAVPRELLVASGAPKDGVPALVDPGSWALADLEAATRARRRGKILVSGDRVVGVSLAGQHRAYPLRFLVWHEVVNDTLGGRPIAVTYSPLCDSTAVFERDLDGERLTFGVSGLLYDSNLVIYDRRAAGGESLWSQLLARAIAGPAAARERALVPLPHSLTTWGYWLAAHPDTTLLAPDNALAGEYKREPYVSYFGSDLLRFPVAPLPPAGGPPLKTPVVVVGAGGGLAAVTYPAVRERVDEAGVWHVDVGDERLTFTYRDRPATVSVAGPTGEPGALFHAFYFAWHATHRDDTPWLVDPAVSQRQGG